MKKSLLFGGFALAITLFGGCNLFQKPAEEAPKAEKSAPRIIEAEGVVIAKELSRFREGTHLLVDADNEVLFILQSKTENLTSFENKKVKIKGEEESADESDKEVVINVLTVELLEETGAEENVIFEFSELGLALTFPSKWQWMEKDGINYFYKEDAEKAPINMESFLLESEAGAEAKKTMEDATEISVGGKRAFRIVDGDKMEIFVVKDDRVILLNFAPQTDAIGEKLVFLEVLTQVRWLDEEENKDSEEEATPCGGEEKKLCPAGFLCELESTEDNAVGVCVDVNKAEAEVKTDEESTVCPQDTKLCPDGTEVGRDNENDCKFSACPEPKEQPDTTDELTTGDEDEEESGEAKDETERTIKAPSSSLETIENSYWSFKMGYPKNYYWQNFGSADGNLAFFGFADIEMEEAADAVITVGIVKGATSTLTEAPKGDKLTVTVPRDENTHFVVTGKEEFADAVKAVARSIENVTPKSE